MVINKIHVESVSVFKAKNNPPIRADSHREKAFQITLEDMQAEGRHVHALYLLRCVQGRENKTDSIQQIRL